MKHFKKIAFVIVLLVAIMIFKSNVSAVEFFHNYDNTQLLNYEIIGSSDDGGQTLDLEINFYGSESNSFDPTYQPKILVLYDVSTAMTGLEVLKYKSQLIMYINNLDLSGYSYVVMPISALYDGYGPEYDILDSDPTPGNFYDEYFFYEKSKDFWVSLVKNEQPSSNFYPPVEFRYDKVIYITTQPSNTKALLSGPIENNNSNYQDCSIVHQDWEDFSSTDYYYVQYNFKTSNSNCRDVIYTDDTNLADTLMSIIYRSNISGDSESNKTYPLELRLQPDSIDYNYYHVSTMSDITVSKNGEIIPSEVSITDSDGTYIIYFHPVSTYDPVTGEDHYHNIAEFELYQNYTINIEFELNNTIASNPNIDEYKYDLSLSGYIPNYSEEEQCSYWGGCWIQYVDYQDNIHIFGTLKDKYLVYFDIGMDYNNLSQAEKEAYGLEDFDIVQEYSAGDVVHFEDLHDEEEYFQGWLLPSNIDGEYSLNSDPLGEYTTTFNDIEKLDDNTFIMPTHNVYVTAVWKSDSVYKTTDSQQSQLIKPESELNSIASITDDGDNKNIVFGDFCWEIIDYDTMKVIYNGIPDEEMMCGTDRKDHGGINESDIINLTNQYYYGTGYYYDYGRNKYVLSGTLEQAIWSDLTANDLIGKYTCLNNSESGVCDTLYYIDSYISQSDAKVFIYDQDINYASIGKSVFNSGGANSEAGLGYMYGDPYYFEESTYVTSEEVVFSIPIDNTYYFAPSYTYSNDEYQFQAGDNPQLISSLSDIEDLLGNYTFFNNDSSYTDDEIYVIVAVDDDNIYYLPLYDGDTINDIEKTYYYGEGNYSYDSQTDTYILDTSNFSSTTNFDWFYDMNGLTEYIICDDLLTCQNNRKLVEESSRTSFVYQERYLFGEDVTYDDVTGKYTLVNATLNEGESGYTCLNQSNTCEDVYFAMDYDYDYYKIIYITLSDGDTIESADEEMLFDLKYDSDIKKVVEEWYRNNLLKYQNYLVDEPFIQDMYDGGFYIHYTASSDLSIDLPAPSIYEDPTIGNGKLTYPIGIFEQGPTDKDITYWIGNSNFSTYNANFISIYDPEYDYENFVGLPSAEGTTEKHDIRPVIYLSPKLKILSGDGSTDRPYYLDDGSNTASLMKMY